jgi:MFS family permease
MYGIRPVLMASMVVFMGFSAGCGAARTIEQLIIFRALQGLGGAGLYSLPSIGFFQLVPPEEYNRINSISSVTMALALVVSPLIGGAISQTGDWRWIFYYNLPAGAVALVLLYLVLPSRFPYHCDPKPEKGKHATTGAAVSDFLRRSDPLGAFLLLGSIIFLVAALEEGGGRYEWNSPVIIVFFVLAGLMVIGFVSWMMIASRFTDIEPTFPGRFAANKVLVTSLIGCVITGAPMTIAAIELPQRYQIANMSDPLGAGVKLLSYAIAMPVGIVLGSILSGRLHLPFIYILWIGATMQVAGFALLSTVPTTVEIWTGIYGYSTLMGLGVGMCAGTYYVLTPIASGKDDQRKFWPLF